MQPKPNVHQSISNIQGFKIASLNAAILLKHIDGLRILMNTKEISFLYVCMVNTIYLFSFVETPRKFIIPELSIHKLGSSIFLSSIISTDEDTSLRIESSAIINLRGVSTKLNKYNKEIHVLAINVWRGRLDKSMLCLLDDHEHV